MQKQYSMEEVRNLLREEIEKNEELVVEVIDDEHLDVKTKSDKEKAMKLYLGNMLRDVNNGQPIKDAINVRLSTLNMTLQHMEDINKLEDWDYVKDKIIFVPQAKTRIENLEKEINSKLESKNNKENNKEGVSKEDIEKNKIYVKPFMHDLVLMGAIDFSSGFMHITKSMQKGWKKTEIEIEDQIVENLKKYEVKTHREDIEGFLHIGPAGPELLPTLLIKPKALREIADKNGFKDKEVICATPFRDLIIMGESSIGNALKLWGMGKSMIDDEFMSYPLTDRIFMIDTTGTINPFKTDEIPAEGVVIAMDSKRKTMSSMAIGRVNPGLRDGPSPEEMEDIIRNDPRVGEIMGFINEAMNGFDAEYFFERCVKSMGSPEIAKAAITKLTERGVIKVAKKDGKFKIFINPQVLHDFFDKRGDPFGFGGHLSF